MTDKNILQKIENLLSKTTENGASEAEAQAAMLKAQELMAKHNISVGTIQNQTEDHKEVIREFVKGGQNCQWMRQLGRVISDNFRCDMLIATGYGICFVGLKEDAQLCSRIFSFAVQVLDKNMKKLRKQYRKQGLSTEGISGDYASGFIIGLRDKFKEQVERNNWGLILVKDNAVTEYTESIKSGKTAKAGRSLGHSGNQALWAKGYKDGKSLADPQPVLTA